MKFGSVCSGIEAASAAWHPLGWSAAWFSEIEPFPCAVLAHHYPDVPNHGDMTTLPGRIRKGEVESPDLFCGGTPCQAFSVAGLRKSLDDERGNLSLTFCEIANAIDDVRHSRGDAGCIVFWENVPGVLNTKDNAFGCFIAGLAGCDTPIVSASGWTNAGMVDGPRRLVAWRVLDAQGFVPQRRRRVFVVAVEHSHWVDPRRVLFESQAEVIGSLGDRLYTGPLFPERTSMQRNPAAGREEGQGIAVASTISTRTGRSDDRGDGTDNLISATYSTPAIGHVVEDDAASCITKNTGAGGETQNPAFVIQSVAFGMDGDVVGTGAIGTITSREGDITDTAHAIAQPVAIQGNLIGRDSGGPQGVGASDQGVMYTLTKADVHGVAQPVTYDFFNITAPVNRQNRQPGDPCHTLARSNAEHAVVMQPVGFDAYNNAVTGDVAKTLDVGQDHHHVPIAFHPTQTPISGEDLCHTLGANENATAAVVAPSLTASNNPSRSPQSSEVTQQVWAVMQATQPAIAWDEELNASVEQAGTLLRGGAGGRHDGVMQPVAFTQNQRDEVRLMEVAGALAAEPGAKQQTYLHQAMQVRRLTPVECERLQGFPDGYTAIPWRKKPVSECPDGPRYKALGNSWAVPVVRWIGRRIEGCRRNPTD